MKLISIPYQINFLAKHGASSGYVCLIEKNKKRYILDINFLDETVTKAKKSDKFENQNLFSYRLISIGNEDLKNYKYLKDKNND